MEPIRRLLASTVLAAAALTACGGGAGSGPPIDDVHYRWEAGDCLLVDSRGELPGEPFGAELVVDCAREHVFEVFSTWEIDGGADTFYPEDLALQAWETCAAEFRGYVGAHLSETALDIVVVRPDAADWEGGARHLACLVEDPRPGGELPLVTGSLRDAVDRVKPTVAAGQCFEARSVLGPAVSCDQSHLAEAIGRFVHPEVPGAAWPGSEEIRLAANDGCSTLLGGYATAGANVVPVTTVAFTRPLSEAEWEDGLRSVECGVLVFDTDLHHVEVVGSLSEADWRAIGAGQAA